MQVEDIARVCFAAGRAPEQQRYLAICPGLLGQVIVDDERVFAVVEEVLTHRTARIRSDVLHGRAVGGGGGNDDGVLHRALFFELPHHARYR